MTREEALRLLRGGAEGIATWNGLQSDEVAECNISRSDLRHVDLSTAILRKANLGNSNLSMANLTDADLSGAVLSNVDFTNANLTGAILQGARVNKANFSVANLTSTDFSGATLMYCNLSGADLTDADFSGASLLGAVLASCIAERTNVLGTTFGYTLFSCDLSTARNLDSAKHLGPSQITVNECLLRFEEYLPERFLKSCGLLDAEIAHFRGQIGKPIRFYTCFICYCTADEEFATRLYNDFQGAGIRCWKWNEDARVGRNLYGEIDDAIRKFDKLVIVVSEASLKSPYVMDEIERALDKERELIRRKHNGEYGGETDVLFPVRIDDYIFEGWDHERKADVKKKVVADATNWDKDNKKYQRMLEKLIRDLKK